jgi:hypothetical protein
MSDSKETITEEYKLKGSQVVPKVKELIKEGNVHKVTLKDQDGKQVMSFPVNVGLIGVAVAAPLVALGAAAALLTDCTIAVERDATS